MKNNKNFKFYFMKNQGITLIALIVTIIVLLILAGISISMLTGNNGIIKKAEEAQSKHEDATDLEYVKLSINYGIIESSTEQSEINNAIQEELRKNDSTATVTGATSEKSITYNGKLYIANLETGDILQTTEEELAKKTLKIKVTTGSDGIVDLPIDGYENCTIDWGDGQVNQITNTDLAQTTHQYSELNVEKIISITGKVTKLTTDLLSDESKAKILEIISWGETELTEIDLSYCTNLTKIASPSENSFKDITSFNVSFCDTGLINIPEDLFSNCPNVTSFSGTFARCTNLETIPTTLFDNCLKVTEFDGTFEDCSNLTGDALPLWERIDGWEQLDFTDLSGWFSAGPPRGTRLLLWLLRFKWI